MSAAFCGNRQKDPHRNQHQLWSYPTIFNFRILSDQDSPLFRDFFLSRMSRLWPHIYHQVCVDFLVPPAALGWRRRHWVQTWELGVGRGRALSLCALRNWWPWLFWKPSRDSALRSRQWWTQDFLICIKFRLNQKGHKDDTGKCLKFWQYIYWT